jgi:TDG/mug DNA glycosylase family protein
MNKSFPPIATETASVLILGSFPGDLSPKRQRYYAHPRNSFWQIMAELLDFDVKSAYLDRLEILKERKIALWDVLSCCQRTGSLDSAIEADSIVVNDFSDFFFNHPNLKATFFNGARAETEFRKRVAPEIPLQHQCSHLCRLPSTSPAMAALSVKQKTEAGRVILSYL